MRDFPASGDNRVNRHKARVRCSAETAGTRAVRELGYGAVLADRFPSGMRHSAAINLLNGFSAGARKIHLATWRTNLATIHFSTGLNGFGQEAPLRVGQEDPHVSGIVDLYGIRSVGRDGPSRRVPAAPRGVH